MLQVAVGALVAALLYDAVVGGRRGEGRAESGGRETGSRRQTDRQTVRPHRGRRLGGRVLVLAGYLTYEMKLGERSL